MVGDTGTAAAAGAPKATVRTGMKKLICVAMIALFSLSAFAAISGKANMSLTTPAQLGGKQLTPGNYKLQWTGEGDNVQVTVLSGKKEVATASAKLVDRPQAAPNDAVVKDNDGSIKQVWFGGKKMSIVFGE
jgi:hypothetical protein